MKWCMNCLREMRCLKNGATLHFGNGHVYDCDIFHCEGCHSQVAKTADIPQDLDPNQLAGLKAHLGRWFIEIQRSNS